MGFMAGRAGVFAMRDGGIAGSVATLDETQSAQGPDRGSTKARRVVLLDAIDKTKVDANAKEAWQQRGEAFFRRQRRKQANGTGEAAQGPVVDVEGVAPVGGGAEAG